MVFTDDASSSAHTLPTTATEPLLLKSNLASQPKTFANVFIAIVGAGVLGLPYAFKRTGWAAGLISLFLVGALTYYCMMLLVYARRRIDSNNPSSTKSPIASYGDLGFAVSGPLGRALVDLMIILSQAGFCVSYIIFIANTLAVLFPASLLSLQAKPFYVWVMFPFQLGLNSVPSLTHLAPLSIFADVVDIAAMGIVAIEDLNRFFTSRPDLIAFGGTSVIMYALGVSTYAFEGIGMVLPLETEAADKEKFGRTLGFSMAFISLMYGLFGLLGYMAFGDETKDIITTNFGHGFVAMLVQVGLCVNLFFTFPIMMNPVYEVVERRLFNKQFCAWARWVVVLLVSIVALLVPNFADFLSLVGSSVCCVLGFVLPAAFHLQVFKNEMSWAGMTSDVAIVVLGIVVAVYGTWSLLADIFFSARV